ncbi:hypothetical protein [Methylomonas sp. MK1]|uniref:hypothetical protein n=1 Tax=Methylomonas sp. MK1 TaxID=1131552 RepID=UPI000370B885|nr:hypothetical protein [Methylomonas sp. MK1]
MSISVTFDSNVWERIVDEEKRISSDPVYSKLFELIRSKDIDAYFFEGLATMETVQKKDRKDHIGNYRSGFSFSVDGEKATYFEGSGSPVISEYLKKTIPKALELGFKFTRMPRIGAPKLEISDEFIAEDKKYELSERLDRSFECARFIESIGSGKGHLMNQLGGSDQGVVPKTKVNVSITDKKYSKAYGEWVDGDALAANYGYGIDFFCTNDRASGAGRSSIFHADNLSQLESKYPVNVISPEDLLSRMESTNAVRCNL